MTWQVNRFKEWNSRLCFNPTYRSPSDSGIDLHNLSESFSLDTSELDAFADEESPISELFDDTFEMPNIHVLDFGVHGEISDFDKEQIIQSAIEKPVVVLYEGQEAGITITKRENSKHEMFDILLEGSVNHNLLEKLVDVFLENDKVVTIGFNSQENEEPTLDLFMIPLGDTVLFSTNSFKEKPIKSYVIEFLIHFLQKDRQVFFHTTNDEYSGINHVVALVNRGIINASGIQIKKEDGQSEKLNTACLQLKLI